MPLDRMNIRLDPAKHGYLTREKADSLKRLDLLDKDADAVKAMIADRIHSNYIYNMSYDEAHGTSKFDIVLELGVRGAKRFRVMVALEYMPDSSELRVITIY
jgi:hypothetical protein